MNSLSYPISNITTQSDTIPNPTMHVTHSDPNKKSQRLPWPYFNQLRTTLRPLLGIVLALIQCLIISLVFLLVSYVKGTSPLVLSNLRMFYQFMISVPISMYRSDPILPPKAYAWPVIARCLAGSLSVIFLMFAMTYAPISDASSITNISPIFVALLAWILLHEKISVPEFILLMIIVVGAVFITRPTFIFGSSSSIHYHGHSKLKVKGGGTVRSYPHLYLGLILAAVSSLTASVAIVTMRKISFLPLSLIIMDYSVVGMILTTILCLSTKAYVPFPCNNHLDRILLVSSAILGSISQFFLYGALRYENAGIVSATTAMGIVFTFVLQIVFKKEIPPWTSWVGAGMITFSIAGLGLVKWYVSKKKSKILQDVAPHPTTSSEPQETSSVRS